MLVKKLLILFILIFMLSNAFAWCSGTDCNSDWGYRQQLELNTEGILTSDVSNEHAILVHVNSSNTDFWDNINNGESYSAGNGIWASLESNLVAYYKLDETSGTNLVDSKGTYDLTLNAGTVNQTGFLGKAVSFTSSTAQYANSTMPASGTNQSMCLWFKPTTGNESGVILGIGTGGTGNSLAKSNGTGGAGIVIGGLQNGVAWKPETDTTYSQNEWQFICYTKTGTTAQLYKNGIALNMVDDEAVNGTGITNFFIGSNTANSAITGVYDEVSVFDIQLSETQVKDLYASQTGLTDVRFTNENDLIDLNYHFESVNIDTNDLYSWVRVPEFDADANTIINMYYGNANAIDNQNETGTYPSTYLTVNHLNVLTNESTDSAITWTNNGQNTTTGQIAGGSQAPANNDSISGATLNIDALTEYSALGWVNYSTLGKSYGFGENAGNGAVLISGNGSTNLFFQVGDGSSVKSTSVTSTASQWEFFAGTAKENGNVTVSVNAGTRDTEAITTFGNPNDEPTVGRGALGTVGSFDEVKFLNYQISTDEESLLFNSESNTLLSFGSQEEDANIYSVTADFNWSIDIPNSQVLLTDTSTDQNVTINAWTWQVDGTTKATTQNYNHSTNANLDLNICLTASGTGIDTNTYTDTLCQNVETWDTEQPTIDVNINPNSFGFVSDFGIDYNMICYDNFSPINYKIVWTNGTTTTLYDSDDANASLLSDTFDLNAGQSAILTFSCTDDYNNLATFTSPQYYALQFNLINEDTGEPFDMNKLTSAIAFTYDGNYVSDLKDANIITENFFSPTDVIRFDFVYPDEASTEISREVDFDYIDDNNIGICVAEYQQFYLYRFLSTSIKPIVLYNDYAKCYNLASTTKFLYNTYYSNTAYTINKPYYLYTYSELFVKSLLALLDGSNNTEINLDILAFNQIEYEYSTTSDLLSVGFSTNDANTIQLNFYSADEYDSVKITVYKDDVSIWSYTETTDTNNFTINFYYGDLDVNKDDLLKAIATMTNGDTVTTIEKWFTTEAEVYQGVLDGFVAMLISAFIMFFGVTMVAYRFAMGWFGLIISFISIGILALAPYSETTLFLMGIYLIIGLFIGVVGKQQNLGVN